MLTALVLTLCQGDLCITKAPFDQLAMTACAINGQQIAAEWIANSPYRNWKLQRYACVIGGARRDI